MANWAQFILLALWQAGLESSCLSYGSWTQFVPLTIQRVGRGRSLFDTSKISTLALSEIFSGKFSKNTVIHGFTPVGRANHYKPSLKADYILKVDRFEVARCSSMYKITDHPFLIHVVGQIRSVQGTDLTKETTRVVIRLLIDP
ncbi:hypothetical protein Bca101_007185 [Brassica carinata]